MLPTREEARKLIRDGLLFNPGPWGKHCLTAAHCAEKIASACGDMDVEKAYILGLLHDIGRKFGVRHLGHVYDGYVYMKSEYYGTAEPPVRCGERHLSGLTGVSQSLCKPPN